jgi:hypothetical protein
MIENLRPDSYILLLNKVKGNLRQKINCANNFLQLLNQTKLDPNYTISANELEKANIDELILMLQQMIETLNAIVWQ